MLCHIVVYDLSMDLPIFASNKSEQKICYWLNDRYGNENENLYVL